VRVSVSSTLPRGARRPSRVSIKDIASQVGVSFQTVSKVLKGGGAVSAETRERILAAAGELGYIPNAVARSLVEKATSTIGVVASDLSDYVLAQFVVGAEREARRSGHAVLIGTIDPVGDDGERYLRMLLERRVDGILLAAPELENKESLGPIGVPAVSIHRVPGGGVTTVGSDHVEVGRLATAHLLERGHKRIATITGSMERRVSQSRLRGYREALPKGRVGFDPALIQESDWTTAGGYEAARRLLERTPDLTAIFAQNDTMALGVLRALYDAGRRVPEDCAIVGCDDLPAAAYTIPPLTTVRIPFYETGEVAMRALLDAVEHPDLEPRRILLPVELVIRPSSG
jgi:LacI family transcriptional regulator